MTTAQDKDAGARTRECFDRQRTHIRAGTWHELDGAKIRVVGTLHQLHGTVCTCCPKREETP